MAETHLRDRYRAVIFDLDGTLRESQPRFMDALHDCLQDRNITTDGFRWRLTERWVHHYWAQSPELLEDIDNFGPESIWLRFLTRLMFHVGHEAASTAEIESLSSYIRSCYQPDSQLMPMAFETLTAIRESGVLMGVLSNRQNPFHEELGHLGIAQFFDFTLAAGEIGIWKPQPQIFYTALARGGDISPAEALYVGDNYYADIVGARNAGLDAVLIDDRHVFTDVICPRIEGLGELLALLDGRLASDARH